MLYWISNFDQGGKVMNKRIISILLTGILSLSLIGCGDKGEAKENVDLKVGMVTDSGTIDDKSFNQGSWEGIKKATDELNVASNYIKPDGESEADYLIGIDNLVDSGYEMIITPGFKFEKAVWKAQEKHQDKKFVLIDGTPNDGKTQKIAENTVSIYFAEHEAGFLAGIATALEVNEGDVGFLGGTMVPAVQKYNWGFQQGLMYANENLGTKINLKKENFVYEGTFTNTAGGQQIAATMYDRGVKVIFAAAGSGGVGAITEAKSRAMRGEKVYIVGVDVDQYDDGVYNKGGETGSVILTSAIKKLSNATYTMVKDAVNNEFRGGETIMFDAKNDGVGLPENNPNLKDSTIESVKDVSEKIKSGEIVVQNEKGNLFD